MRGAYLDNGGALSFPDDEDDISPGIPLILFLLELALEDSRSDRLLL